MGDEVSWTYVEKWNGEDTTFTLYGSVEFIGRAHAVVWSREKRTEYWPALSDLTIVEKG